VRNSDEDGQGSEDARRVERLLVGTRSGTFYLIDIDAMRLKRVPATGAEMLASDGERTMSQPLRRDGQWLKILRLGPLALGECLNMHLEPLGDPTRVAFTARRTTEIVSITAVEPPPARASATATD
jgi:hypothetical protein